MKFILFITSLLFIAASSFAQTEATIEYKIEMSTDNPEVEAQLAMMEGSTMKMYMKDGNVRNEMSMGGFMKTTNITNAETNETLMLMDGMMGKYAAKMKMDDLAEEDAEGSEEDLDIELVDETKEVAGYNCKKAIIYDADGNENIFWYTEEIEAPKNGGKYLKEGIPGMALEFSVVQPQITMTFTATEFSKKVKNAKEKFDMTIPEGYTEKSIEDLQNMMGGAQ
jgi:GLPGLI family protein